MDSDTRPQATVRHTVAPADTAMAVGSGSVEVLATPKLLALMEATTLEAQSGLLEPGQTSVGTRVQIEHRRPSPLGAEVIVHARLSHHEGRELRFDVAAEHADGTLIASGHLTRTIVDAARFLARAGGR